MRFLRFILTFLFLLISSYGHADDSDKLLSYPEGKIIGFLGLDTRSSSPLLSDGRAKDIQNVVLSRALDARKRDGYSVINATLDQIDTNIAAVTGIFDASFSNGTNFPIVFLGKKIFYDNVGTWTQISVNRITAGQNNQFQCITAFDNAVCTNDVDKPLQISSTPTVSDVVFGGLSNPITKAKGVIWFRNYLIFVNTVEGSTERPTRFRWSNVGTINTWDDDDFIDISELSGDEIIGISELQGNLYLFFKDSIYRVTLVGGNDVFEFNKIIEGIGAISRDSIRNVKIGEDQIGIIFLNERKRIYFFNGFQVVDIGSKIQPTLDNLNESRLTYSVATWDDSHYFLSASTSGVSTNDIIFDYATEIGEWSKHIQIDANVFGRVKNSSKKVRTYFGNYNSFVYWMNNEDLINDVDGAVGTVDSVGTISTSTSTGSQMIIDAALASGSYAGATITITAGTGVGQEAVILTSTSTGLVVTTPFSTTPDSTSSYSIGSIDAYYETKFYDFGQSERKKSFRSLYFWSKENTSSELDFSYSIDFGDTLYSETIDLGPESSSVWDTALWDVGTWGKVGDSFNSTLLYGNGRSISLKFENDDIDENFHLYGFHLIGDSLDVR